MSAALPAADPARPHHARHIDGSTVVSLADILRHRAAYSPDAVAMRDTAGSTTFAELDARASQVAHALLGEGVGPGDRVAYVGGNTPVFLEVVNGAARIGALPAPVNNRLSENEVAAILGDAEASVVVLGPEQRAYAATFADLPTVRRVVCVADLDPSADYASWLADRPRTDPGYVGAPADPALLFYTSGTTGRPKGIVLSGDNIGQALGAVHHEIVFTDASVAMAPVPFFHVAGLGLALTAQLQGSTLLLEPASDVHELIDLLVRRRVSHAVLVPTVLQAVLDSPAALEADWSSLQYVVYGASPIPLSVIRKATQVLGCRFLQSYGLTETTGGVTLLRPEDHTPGQEHLGRLASAGRALAGVALRVVDPVTLEDVPTGQHGEVLIGGGQVMLGYWRRERETSEAVVSGGWLRTGDGGSLDADGYLFLHDRLKDMIISGGENVFPAEVESVLTEHPDVGEVAVVGVASAAWGESPYAVVVRRAGSELDELELLAWARERLAHFKCPVGVRFVNVLPRNASGKLLKARLRRELGRSAR